jgi:hypothetical protein
VQVPSKHPQQLNIQLKNFLKTAFLGKKNPFSANAPIGRLVQKLQIFEQKKCFFPTVQN